MGLRNRVVTRLPLGELWTDDGELSATRGAPLNRHAVREYLRRGPVRFVVANIGQTLRWIPLGERFEFWRRDVSLHLSDSGEIYLDEFPGGMAYWASEWTDSADETPIILLEVAH